MGEDEMKKILVLDFDGVLHSYKSGWKGPRVISDPPTPGAMLFLREAVKHFEVYILSSRSKFWFGRRAMKQWLYGYLHQNFGNLPAGSMGDPPDWTEADEIFTAIKWPSRKPAAFLTIDDRAIQFTGEFPSMDRLYQFKPWTHGEPSPPPPASVRSKDERNA